MQKNKPAFIMLYVLMMLSLIVFLAHQMMRGVFVGSQFARTMVDREKAEMLALGGVNIAMAQLLYDPADEKGEENKSEDANKGAEDGKARGLKKYVGRLIPHLNRWQEYALTEKIDGIDGVVRVCITCESGKININEVFDFTKMEFKKIYEALLKGLEIPGRLQPGEMVTRLTEFFKARKRKLDDVSELQQIAALRSLDIFYRPPVKALKGKKSSPNPDIALQDIFTTWTADDKIDLLWLSDALCAIFGVRRPLADDALVRKERFNQFLQQFSKDKANDWDANWKVIESIYEQKPKILSELKNILSKEFGPKVFSVLSCGKVGLVEQTLLAVIREEEQKEVAEDKPKGTKTEEKDKQKSKEGRKMFKILRVYWL